MLYVFVVKGTFPSLARVVNRSLWQAPSVEMRRLGESMVGLAKEL